MVEFWAIVVTSNDSHICERPTTFNTTTKNLVSGITFFILSLINIFAHTFLISIIFFNWKAIFHQFFVYRLILCMNFIAVINMLVHFGMTIPCSITGCLYYPTWLVELMTGMWRTLEYGFFVAVLFIAIDRFVVFYFRYYEKIFQKVIIILMHYIMLKRP
jgi:hypothetical protein